MTDWFEITRRNARSVQTTVGWIFWDPGAVSRLGALGLPHPLGYIAARAAPLGPAGPEAITAAFLDGAAAVQVRVLHDGVATAAAVAIACARTPAIAGYLRPARAQVGGPPGTAIALALLSLRDD